MGKLYHLLTACLLLIPHLLITSELSKKEEMVMEEIVTTVAKHSPFMLTFKVRHLQTLSKKLPRDESLKILLHLFSNDQLKQDLISIRKSRLKWNLLLPKIKKDLAREITSKRWMRDLQLLAQSLEIDLSRLEKKAEEGDWEGFIYLLFK